MWDWLTFPIMLPSFVDQWKLAVPIACKSIVGWSQFYSIKVELICTVGSDISVYIVMLSVDVHPLISVTSKV